MSMMRKQIMCVTSLLVLYCLCAIGFEYYLNESCWLGECVVTAAQGFAETNGLGFVQHKVLQTHKALMEDHEEEEKYIQRGERFGTTGQPQLYAPVPYQWTAPAPSPLYYHGMPPAPAPTPSYYHWMPPPAPAPAPGYHYWMPAPAPAPSYHGPVYFHVNMGNCIVNEDSSCVTSPSYPGEYNNSQGCTISASGSGTFSAVDFQTERNYDKLFINFVPYHGTRAPSWVPHYGNSIDISWTSDGSVTSKGWKLCNDFTGQPPAPIFNAPMPAPADHQPPAPAIYSYVPEPQPWYHEPAPAPSSWLPPAPAPALSNHWPTSAVNFHVNMGDCKVDDDHVCVASPSYPGDYNNSQGCTITAFGSGTFSAVDFQTEGDYDKLFINSVP